MVDRLKGFPQKALEWWNKFTSKQKTIIISVASVVILAIAILVTVLTRPQYAPLAMCETTKEAAAVTDLLDESEMTYTVSEDGYQIHVLKEQLSDANLLLGANNIPSAAYGIDNVMEGGFSTTESDKQKKYKLYLEGKLEEDLESNNAVIKARVQLSIPENDGTLISKDEESHASVVLTLEGELEQNVPSSMAKTIAAALGNDTTQNVVIIDTDGNLLFSGEDNYTVAGNASNQLGVKQQAENLVKNEVRKVMVGTNLFDTIEVGTNLDLDFSTTEKTWHDFTPAEGQTQGVLSEESTYQSNSTGGNSGVPGTDSNDETTYVIEDNAYSESSVMEENRKYLPNEIITSQTIPPGLIIYENSSLSISATQLKVFKEEDIEAQGLLDGVTWNEYKTMNEAKQKIEVDEELYGLVAKVTGIAEEDIAILAYEEPIFIDAEGLDISVTDIIQILLIVVILAMLAFVVIRSMRGEKGEDAEAELSVESLLQSTPEPEIERIGTDTMSETRRVIERFVEENPEAAASLLRNWLNEDWG